MSLKLRIAMIGARMCPYQDKSAVETGGMQILMRDMARCFSEHGAQITLFTGSHDGSCRTERSSAIKVVHLPGAGNTRHITKFTNNLLRHVSSADHEYDVIYSHYWTSAIAGRRLANMLAVPHIISFHSLAAAKKRHRGNLSIPTSRLWSERLLARSADLVVAWTRDEFEMLCNDPKVSCDNIKIVPPGVDTDRFKPLNKDLARRKLGITADQVILSVGRLDPLKGIDILLNAFNLLEQDANRELHIVTTTAKNSQAMRDLKKAIARLGVKDRVVLWSKLDRAELIWHYSAADMLVMPSYYESFGLAALEAEACGCPVVATKVGGLKDIVRDGETGYLIPWKCPEPFANTVEMLLGNTKLRDHLATASRRHAGKFNWQDITDKLLTTFHQTLTINRFVS